MTSDPYQAYPAFPAGAPAQLIEPPAVQFIAAGPARQRRLTVAFRLILAVPHLFALLFLGIAGLAIAFVGWWGALFTGRLPDFAVGYLSGWARWNIRVNGYLYLLTDVYPPFTLDEDLGYPVCVAIPERERLNRFAVFFRLILGSWAYLVSSLVSGGASAALVIGWAITLVTGKLPTPLHLALTAVLRFQVRYFCYLGLLTPTYPAKLFGDQPRAVPPVPAAPAETMPPTETMPPVETAWGAPAGYGARPGYGTPESVYGAPGGYGGARPASPSAEWQLILPRSAKRLLIVFIALGLIVDAGSQFRSATLQFRAVDRAVAVAQWNSANSALNANMSRWQTEQNACDQSQNLACATKASGQAASYLTAFASQVRAISMPSAAGPAATRVVAEATRVAQDFSTLSHAATAAQFEGENTSTGLAKDLASLQSDNQSVADALDNS